MNNNIFPPQTKMYIPYINIEKEIEYLKYEINILKQKIHKLEHQNTKDYLKKDDNYYIL